MSFLGWGILILCVAILGIELGYRRTNRKRKDPLDEIKDKRLRSGIIASRVELWSKEPQKKWWQFWK